MPVFGTVASEQERIKCSRIVRRAKCIRGEVQSDIICAARFGYARVSHQIKQVSETELLFLPEGFQVSGLRLRAQAPLRREGDGIISDFVLKAGEKALFVRELDGGGGGEDLTVRETESFKGTLNFWQGWIGRSNYAGRWREIVDRSALVLKLLTNRQYGSIVAAPTFGLPELVGGGRNWDYRFTWIRDARFTLYPLSRLGFTEEAPACVM